MLICQFFLCFLGVGGQAFAKNVNDFYFDNFEADYYLSKDESGTSKMHVVEQLTAVFPEHQNKGVCRRIPYTNQSGGNRTIDDLNRSNIILLRNGKKEPIYSIEKKDLYYEVCTGDDEYVSGTQIYTLEYDFKRVVTDFSTWQELYWDTNGTGWAQKFNNLTARIHVEDLSIIDYSDINCYVGSHGEKGSERCAITKIQDGLQFSTASLRAYENLTFSIKLKQSSFAIPDPEKNYMMFGVLAGVIIISILMLISPIKRFKETKSKRKFYKEFFITPEYSAPKDCSLPEMASLYIGRKKDVKVAVMLDMIVKGKIEMFENGKGAFGKQKWAVRIMKDAELETYEEYILKILNGGKSISDVDVIEIKSHSATSSLVSLGKSFDSYGGKTAKSKGLLTPKADVSTGSYKNDVGWILLLFFVPMFVGIFAVIFEDTDITYNGSMAYLDGKILVGFDEIKAISIMVILLMITIRSILSAKYKKVYYHTEEGLKMSRYMDGLKMYITMAEKDRLEFLQSVKKAPRDAAGIVKLNEKLLPYAALFGVEESWMKELSKYYEINDTPTPTWYHTMHAYNFATMNKALHTASSYATSSTHFSSSGGSGGGGGGFSGGGGGGGGGGGR